jgi:hypothetical protein
LRSVEHARSGNLADSVSPAPAATAVTLVSTGSLGTAPDTEKVKSGLVPLARQGGAANGPKAGRIGWWVGDESLKARVKDDPYLKDSAALTDSSRAFRAQSPGRAHFRSLPGMDQIAPDASFNLVHSRRSAELLEGASDVIDSSFHHATPYSLGLLSDVREGGLKRDLSTILERPIRLEDSADDFMLYRFDNDGQERVPIQDLSAYYQLYRAQLRNSSTLLRSGFQVINPDFGRGGTAFTREYTSMYRQPIPIRVQYMLSLLSQPRTQAEMNANPANADTHKLHVGITPAITFWNPNNVPLTLNLGPDFANQFRFFNMPFTIKWTKEGRGYSSPEPVSLAWLSRGLASGGDRDTGFTVFTSGTRPIQFEPGQVRVFSLANQTLNELRNSDTFRADREVVAGWDPSKFIRLTRSDPAANPNHIEPKNGGPTGPSLFPHPTAFHSSLLPPTRPNSPTARLSSFFSANQASPLARTGCLATFSSAVALPETTRRSIPT